MADELDQADEDLDVGETPAPTEEDTSWMDELTTGSVSLWNVADSAYHADRRCSSYSTLKLLWESPKAYRDTYVTPRAKAALDRMAMLLGTIVHWRLLEPHRFDAVHERAKGLRRGTKAYAAWQAGLPEGACIVPDGMRARAERMAAELLDHPSVADLLARDGLVEQAAVWREPATGELIRVKWDKVVDLGDLVVVLDIKTSPSVEPTEFARSVSDYRYHLQGGIYTDVASAFFGKPARHVLGVVSSADSPERACFELGRHELDTGRQQYRALLRQLQRRRRDDDWLAAYERGVKALNLPGYLLGQVEEESDAS